MKTQLASSLALAGALNEAPNLLGAMAAVASFECILRSTPRTSAPRRCVTIANSTRARQSLPEAETRSAAVHAWARWPFNTHPCGRGSCVAASVAPQAPCSSIRHAAPRARWLLGASDRESENPTAPRSLASLCADARDRAAVAAFEARWGGRGREEIAPESESEAEAEAGHSKMEWLWCGTSILSNLK
jgi:hypothetical protein